MQLRHLIGLTTLLLALAGCETSPPQGGAATSRDAALPQAAPAPPGFADRPQAPSDGDPEVGPPIGPQGNLGTESESEAAPQGEAPHIGRRRAFEAALPARRARHDQALWDRLTTFDDERRRTEVLAALLATRSEQEILTALDWTMDRLYAGKGTSAYLAAYALLHQRAGFVEGAILGDLLARLRIAEDAARCAYLPAAKDKLLMILQLLAPLTAPLEQLDPEVRRSLAAHVLAENRDLPRNSEDSWLCRGGPAYTTRFFQKHGSRPTLQALRIETESQTMVLLPDDPEIETGGFRDEALWQEAVASLRADFERRYGVIE